MFVCMYVHACTYARAVIVWGDRHVCVRGIFIQNIISHCFQVMGVTRFGGYTTHLLCEATYVRPLPDGWGFQEVVG
jgi:hypothetical protein